MGGTRKVLIFAPNIAMCMNRNLLIIILSALLFIPQLTNAKSTHLDTKELYIENYEPSISPTLNGSNLRVVGGAGQTLEIYNITGVRVAIYKIDSNDKTISLNVNRGCYIVKIGKISRKISVL